MSSTIPTSDATTALRALFYAHWLGQESLTAAALSTARQTGDATFAVREALDPRHQLRGDLPASRLVEQYDLDADTREAAQMAIALLVDDVINNTPEGPLHGIARKAQHLHGELKRLVTEQRTDVDAAVETVAADASLTRICLSDLVARARVIKEQRALAAALARAQALGPVKTVAALEAVLPGILAELEAFDLSIDRGLSLKQALFEDLAHETDGRARPTATSATPRPSTTLRRR